MLIESPANESDEQFGSYVTELLTRIYGKIPNWLEFQVGERFERNKIFFRRFICPAGSVSSQMQIRAGQRDGISRAIIIRGHFNGLQVCSEIRAGIEIRFDCGELHPV